MQQRLPVQLLTVRTTAFSPQNKPRDGLCEAPVMHTSVREIHVSSQPDSAYFLRVDWRGRGLGSGFHLLLTDGQDAWRGEVSEAVVCAEAEELEMQTERYVQNLQQALTGTESSVSYSFTLTPSPPNHSSTVTLAYEKVQKDISFRLGSVSLKSVPEPTEAVRELLVHSLQRGNTLEHQNQDLEEENQRLRREQQRITAELKRYTGGKETLEAELYSRFVLVLNEKKAKIRSLQETVTQLQETRSSEGRKQKDSAKSDRTAGGQEEEAEDEYGGSTDEEPEEVQTTPAPTVQSRESSTPSPLDDSLKDITDVAPSRKRRFRHLGAPAPAPAPQTSQKKRSSTERTERRRSRERSGTGSVNYQTSLLAITDNHYKTWDWSDSPAGSSKQQTPQRSADAVAACSAAEDLFEDF